MDTANAKDILEKANDVLLVTHERPTADSVGATLALYLGLTGMGKKVTVVCPDPIIVGLSNFVGANKFISEVGKKNFVISLDYTEGSIEKVSYAIEGDRFNLVIEPRAGHGPFSQDNIKYFYQGASPDVIIAVDTIHLGGLKKAYESEKELFATKPIVNIDRHPNNAQYGQVNLVDPKASSTAEVAAQLLSHLGVALTPDIATNLLNAVYEATNLFRARNVTPIAFELVAACMKAGGKRFNEETKETPEELPVKEAAVTPPTEMAAAPLVPQEGAPREAPEVKEAPADWLKPKIFRSSSG
jgi:nanoRNase/pAp phosphatase (c-di-AMP/oligoRNAs hydrolase)